MSPRKTTRPMMIGNVSVGGDAPVRIQSMCTTPTHDVAATVSQIQALEEAGCEIIRVACPTEKDANALGAIKSKIKIPLVADIHFNYRLALIALDQGIDKLRLNPGNIGSRDRIEAVVKKAKERGVPIRIGVNGGSLEKDLLEKYKHPVAEALVESAERHVKILEELDFQDIVISLKASDVLTMVSAYRLASKRFDYPLNLGVTEAGTLMRGSVYNSIGVGTLLMEGIGDTIRVSLAGPSRQEVKTGFEILKSLNLREKGPILVACPSCRRADVDVLKLAASVEKFVQEVETPLKIAVMGCEVNGPGEAKDADIGIAGGNGRAIIFRKGVKARIVPESEMLEALMEEVRKTEAEMAGS